MNFSNVKLILAREVRDQLRDRRTLFMIAVLPVLLYPLLGISLFQISQFVQEQSTRVLVVGVQATDDLPRLFDGRQFAGPLFSDPTRGKLLELEFAADVPPGEGDASVDARAEAHRRVQAGEYEAALWFPPDFVGRLEACRAAIRRRMESQLPSPSGRGAGGEGGGQSGQSAALALILAQRERAMEVPSPEIIYSTANDKSRIAFARLSEVLRRWTERIAEDNLAESGVPRTAVRPFLVESADVADDQHREASMWSKILPVLVLLWALTGAFYPAVDLCAGEKERGHARDVVVQSGRTERNRRGQTGHDHALQHRHRRAEPVEHGADGLDGGHAVAGLRAALRDGRCRVADRLDSDGGAVQRLVAGLGGLRAEHEGRAILSNALAAGHDAAGGLADGARRRVELGEQPDSDHRRRVAAAQHVGGQLLAGGPVLAARGGGDAAGLSAGDPLGRRSVQPRVGAVPRERTPGRRAVAAAPAARPVAHADGRCRRLLRCLDLDDSFLPQPVGDDAGRLQRTGPDGARDATGGDCRAGRADDAVVLQ